MFGMDVDLEGPAQGGQGDIEANGAPWPDLQPVLRGQVAHTALVERVHHLALPTRLTRGAGDSAVDDGEEAARPRSPRRRQSAGDTLHRRQRAHLLVQD